MDILQSSHTFIKTISFIGIVKCSIVKDYHKIFLKIDFFKIHSPDTQLVDMVAKSCLEDHTNPDALKIVSSEMMYSKKFDYNEAEYFRNYLSYIEHRNISEDQKNNTLWKIDFKFQSDINHFSIVLPSELVYRIYTHVNSFYTNFLLFSSILKFTINNNNDRNLNQKIKDDSKLIEQAAINNQTVQNAINIDDKNERTDIDDFFELCVTTPIKSSLIHYIFNYFQFINNEQCKINFATNDPNQIQIVAPLIIPGKFNIDQKYFKSLIISSTIPTNTISFMIKKILNILTTKANEYQHSPIYIMILLYILFIYLMRFFYDSNKDSFDDYFYRLICSENTQKSLLTKLINSTFKEYSNKIFFEIKNNDNISNDLNYTELIETLSSQYKHLIPISQIDFADKIFKELTSNINETPINFCLNSKKIIDITQYIYIPGTPTQRYKKQQSSFFDPDNEIDNIQQNELFEYSYLNYELIKQKNGNDQRIISNAYNYIIMYSKNPSTILMIDDKTIPKEVLKLYELICKNILNTTNITKDNISTLDYYNLLLKKLPNVHLFRHSILLYIIYQIIIPFHYDMYNNTQFIDYFL